MKRPMECCFDRGNRTSNFKDRRAQISMPAVMLRHVIRLTVASTQPHQRHGYILSAVGACQRRISHSVNAGLGSCVDSI